MASLAGAAPALGECMEPPPLPEHLAQTDTVFVGIVREVTDGERRAHVEVREIWHGPDLPAGAVVNGGWSEPGARMSLDRTYQVGVRYLFAVDSVAGRLEDTRCTATRPWKDGLAALRPADARLPEPSSEATHLSGLVIAGVAAAGAIALAVGAFVVRRRWLFA